MERRIQLTADGSHTIFIPGWEVTYHSIHGAIQESLHVYIEAGLKYQLSKKKRGRLSILEMGFGTGLNALLTVRETIRGGSHIYYQSIEKYPLVAGETIQLNYEDLLSDAVLAPYLATLHGCPWDTDVQIHPAFCLHKTHLALQEVSLTRPFDIIYYDAFDPVTQPELWTEAIFTKMYSYLAPEGILVTYCSKGDVRRAMQAVGFIVEKIPGAPYKREMLRATKR